MRDTVNLGFILCLAIILFTFGDTIQFSGQIFFGILAGMSSLWVLFAPSELVSRRSIVVSFGLVMSVQGLASASSQLLAGTYALAALLMIIGFLRNTSEAGLGRNGLLTLFIAVTLGELVIHAILGFGDWFFFWISIPTIVFGFTSRKISSTDLTYIKNFVVYFAFLQALIGIFEFYGGRLISLASQFGLSPHAFMQSGVRSQGFLGHPLVFSFLLGFALFLVFERTDRRWWHKIPVSITLVLGVFASGSSSAVICVVAGSFLLLYRSRSIIVRVASLTTAAVAVLFSSQFSEILRDVTGSAARHRLESVNSLPNLVFDREFFEWLFGSGRGNIDNVFLSGLILNSDFRAVDNQFIYSVASGGILGGVALLALCLILLFRSFSQANFLFPLVAFSLAMFLSFDILVWASSSLLFCVLIYMVDLLNRTDPRKSRYAISH